MRLYTCTIEIGGNRQHVVTGKIVSVPEIAVLRHIHGDVHVSDFKTHAPVGKWSAEQIAEGKAPIELSWDLGTERERLMLTYPPAADDEKAPVLQLFGPIGRLPDSLAELNISTASLAAEKRAAAAKLLADAGDLETQGDDADALFDTEEVAAPKTRAKAA